MLDATFFFGFNFLLKAALEASSYLGYKTLLGNLVGPPGLLSLPFLIKQSRVQRTKGRYFI